MRVERGRDYGKMWGRIGSEIGQNEYDDYSYGVPVPGYIKECYNDRAKDYKLYGLARVTWDSGKEVGIWPWRQNHIGKAYEESETKDYAGIKRYDLHIVSDGGKFFKTLYLYLNYFNTQLYKFLVLKAYNQYR